MISTERYVYEKNYSLICVSVYSIVTLVQTLHLLTKTSIGNNKNKQNKNSPFQDQLKREECYTIDCY